MNQDIIYWVETAARVVLFWHEGMEQGAFWQVLGQLQTRGKRLEIRQGWPEGLTIEDEDEVLTIANGPCDRQLVFSLVWEPPAESH